MSRDLLAALPELEQIIRSSTFHDKQAWLDHTRRTLDGFRGRAESIASLNRARAAVEQVDLDVAVAAVLGVMEPSDHGAATVVQKRIRAAVRMEQLSSTLGSSNFYDGAREPKLPAIRRSLDRLIANQSCAPVLGRHPESVSLTYASAARST